MAKKLSILIAAVAVLAFAVPSMASAAEATLPAGTRAPTPTEATGTGTNIELNSSTLGPIICSTLNLNATITKNDGTTIEASGSNTEPTQAGCKNGSNEVKVTNVVVTKLFSNDTTTNAIKKGTVSFTAKVDVGTKLVCEFTGTNVAGTYEKGTNVLKASNASGVTSPGCGTATLSGSFKIEKKGTTTPIVLD